MKWFVNLKVRTKLTLSLLVIAVLTIVVGALGICVILNILPGSMPLVVIIGALCAAALVITVLLGYYNAFLVVDPMWKNQRLMERFSVGNLNVVDVLRKRDGITLEYKDEIGSFSRTFKDMMNYMRGINSCINTVAQGDLSVKVPVSVPEDQIGNGLAALVNNFHQLVATIVVATEQVASGANLVSDSSFALSQGATHQASSVQELTASLEQISSQTHLNAQNAEKANDLATSAKINASDGNVQMREMLTAMEDISISSNNISKIIKVIDDIAFQTNILALNAAVEAARAGQHGKGFAVVAEEVRNLAGKSANAAKETTDMIENSIRKVEAGTKIANQTAKSLNEIVVQVDRAADLISSIAAASVDQAQGIEQINLGIAQVSQVIQTNAATAEESAAASEELSEQAARLKENVSQFKLRASQAQDNVASQKRTSNLSQSRQSATSKSAAALSSGDFGKY